MLDQKGFDLWADGYDRSVGLSDEEGTYPFAGYRKILNEIYNRVLSGEGRDVLDIGFGTGALTAKLYEKGCRISGQDFSEKMIRTAQGKMPEALLVQGDFSKGLADVLKEKKYDAIIATYSLHHLTDAQKVCFIRELKCLLKEDGCIYIGDVMFEDRKALEECRKENEDSWDEDEIYFVCTEMKEAFPKMEYRLYSSCSGLMILKNSR
jgi:putative AdoMet-dependent methyltransferase